MKATEGIEAEARLQQFEKTLLKFSDTNILSLSYVDCSKLKMEENQLIVGIWLYPGLL